jgi:hypothetical protein
MNAFCRSIRELHPDTFLKPNNAVVVIATGEKGVVVASGRDKITGEDVVCVELFGRPGSRRWGFYPPAALTSNI